MLSLESRLGRTGVETRSGSRRLKITPWFRVTTWDHEVVTRLGVQKFYEALEAYALSAQSRAPSAGLFIFLF